MLDSLRQDLRFALRQLTHAPGFTTATILSLALGVGANLAMFQLIDAIRLRTIPVSEPERLALIDWPETNSYRAGWSSTRSARFTTKLTEEIAARQQAFSSIAIWSAARFNLAQGGEARNAEGLYVNGAFFETLGVNAWRGRTIQRSDDTPACSAPGLVLSYSFWQREFGGQENALGRLVRVQGQEFPVIGITGPEFTGVEVGNRYDFAIPLCVDRLLADDKKGRAPVSYAWWVAMMGRLKPGWTVARAKAQLEAVSPAVMQAAVPDSYKKQDTERFFKNRLDVRAGGTGVSGLRRTYERPLLLLLAITGVVLLIACANVANLLLARASVREKEIAVRLAMGASRVRLVRQMLAESLLLAAGAAVCGLVISQALSRGLVAFLDTSGRPLFVSLGLDARVLAFTSGVALLTCVLTGLLPALRATANSPAHVMRAQSRGTTAGREGFSWRRTLVVAQVALSLLLVAGALLFVRSLTKLLHAEAGFQAEGVVTVSVDFARLDVPKDRREAYQQDLEDRLSRVAGITSVARVMCAPVSGCGWDNSIGPDGAPAAGSGKDSLFNRVSPGYFKTMSTPLLAGRDFNRQDTLGSPKVAVVNEEFARKYLPGRSPIGRTFRREAPASQPEPLFEVIGLVKNTKYFALRESYEPIAFVTTGQEADPQQGANYVVRIQGSPGLAMAGIKAAMAEANPQIALEFRSLTRQLEESLTRERLMAALSGGFGVLAAVLAALGLYSVIAYMVAQRRNEIGIRMALGASRSNVVGLVLREALILAGAGTVVGIGLALWTGQAAATLLYDLKPHDPVSLGAAVALLAFIALAASWLPARRASSVDPAIALRFD